jgi:hypothetical protein
MDASIRPFRYTAAVLVMLGAAVIWNICGCSRPAEPQGKADLLRRLAITEWDLAAYSGKRIRVSSVHDDEHSVEFPATADVRLVTQIILPSNSVAVFLLDESGTSTTVLNVDDTAGGLRPTKDAASGVLYEYNETPVIVVEVPDA